MLMGGKRVAKIIKAGSYNTHNSIQFHMDNQIHYEFLGDSQWLSDINTLNEMKKKRKEKILNHQGDSTFSPFTSFYDVWIFTPLWCDKDNSLSKIVFLFYNII